MPPTPRRRLDPRRGESEEERNEELEQQPEDQRHQQPQQGPRPEGDRHEEHHAQSRGRRHGDLHLHQPEHGDGSVRRQRSFGLQLQPVHVRCRQVQARWNLPDRARCQDGDAQTERSHSSL